MNRQCGGNRLLQGPALRIRSAFMRALLLGACVLAHLGTARAQEPGDFTVSYGFTYLSDARRPNQLPVIEKLPGSFNFWVTPLIIVHASSDTYKWRKFGSNHTNGVGDTSLGVEMDLPDNDLKLQVSFDYTTKLPTADSNRRLGSGEIDHVVTASIGRDIGSRTNITADFADYIAGQAGGKYLHYFSPDVVAKVKLDKKGTYKLVSEFDVTPAAHGDPTDALAIVGIAYKANQHLTLKGGFRVGFTPYTSKAGFYMSLQLNGSMRPKREP